MLRAERVAGEGMSRSPPSWLVGGGGGDTGRGDPRQVGWLSAPQGGWTPAGVGWGVHIWGVLSHPPRPLRGRIDEAFRGARREPLRPWFRPGSVGGHWGFPGGSDDKESACNAGDLCSISGLGRSPGGGNGNPLQYSFLFFHSSILDWRTPWTEEPGGALVHGV